MSLLAPLFLLGALAIAAPVLAHLVRRSTRQRVQFSATQFLEPSPPTVSKRKRLEHPWLLLLRALIVAMLALAFARPYLQESAPIMPSARAPRHVVAVLDQSASMQRGARFETALNQLRELVEELQPGDRMAIVGTDAGAPLLSFETWSRTATGEGRQALVTTAIADLQPGWGSTHLDTAMEMALEEIEAMNESAGGAAPAEIVVISDFTSGSRLSGLAGREWPGGVHVSHREIPTGDSANVSLHFLGHTELADGERAARLRLSNESTRPRQVTLTLKAAASSENVGEVVEQVLAPGERRVVRMELPDTAPEALKVELAGDDEPFDNVVWLVRPSPLAVTLAYVGGAGADDPSQAHFYLSRALRGTRLLAPHLVPVDPSATALPEAALFVVDAVPSPNLEAALADRLRAGAFVLVLARDGGLVAAAGRLAGEEGWTTRSYARADALLGTIDFRHPQFELFADPRFSDFTRVRFWEPVPVILPETTNARAVARFEEGSPAVIEANPGTGTLLVWGGGWNPEAGQWVLSSKFVPWLQSLLVRAAGGARGVQTAAVGELARLGAARNARWQRIDNTDTEEDSVPAVPGIYRVNDASGSRVVALQVPVEESDNTTIALDVWEELGVPLTPGEAGVPERQPPGVARAVELEAEQKLWRWLLLLAVVVLATESLVSISLARRSAPPSEAAA